MRTEDKLLTFFLNRSGSQNGVFVSLRGLFQRPWQSQPLENQDCFVALLLAMTKNNQNSTYHPVNGYVFSCSSAFGKLDKKSLQKLHKKQLLGRPRCKSILSGAHAKYCSVAFGPEKLDAFGPCCLTTAFGNTISASCGHIDGCGSVGRNG